MMMQCLKQVGGGGGIKLSDDACADTAFDASEGEGGN